MKEVMKIMNIGNYLKNIRSSKNISQERLAELVGVCDKTIRRIEKSSKPKENETLKKICSILGISASDIQPMNISTIDTDFNYLTVMSILGYNNLSEITTDLKNNLSNAFALLNEGNYKEALEIYLAFSKLFPNESTFLACASIYHILNQHEKAIEFSNKALEINANNCEALTTKGISLTMLKNYDDAIKILESALLINQTYLDHYNLGVTYLMNFNYSKAILHYKNCLEVNPNFAPAHLNISISYLKTYNFDDTLHHLDKAINLTPDMHQAYAIKSECYRYMNNFDAAVKCLEKCLSLDPENYQALLCYAMLLASTEKSTESAIYFKKLIKSHSEAFFNVNTKIGHKILLADIWYKTIQFITFEYCGQDIVKVYINGLCIPVNMKKNNTFIFLGSIGLSDEVESTLLYPAVGKVFEDRSEFDKVITNIKSSIDLFQYFDKPFYIDTENKIKVNIQERENNVFLEINFDNKFQIIGITDGKSGGLESFINEYNQHGQFRIHLEYDTEIFIIDCLKNVSIDKLHK